MRCSRSVAYTAALVGAALLPGMQQGAATTDPEPKPALEGRIVFSRLGGKVGLGGDDPCWLWTARADGSEQECLVAEEWFLPWAAADGTRVVMAGDAPDGRVIPGIVDLADASSWALDPPGDTLSLASGPFSRDGAQLALNGFDAVDPTRTGIYIAESDDLSTARQVVQTAATSEPRPGPQFAVDFSPDGTQLVLYHQAPGDNSDTHGWLDVVNVDGTGLRRLTPEGVDIPCCAHWSPDGERILFAEVDGRMLTIEPDGQNLADVFAEEGGWVRQPHWSPDGSQIVFALDSVPNPNLVAPNVLCVINADGTGRRVIIDTPDRKGEAFWVPDVRDGA